MFNPNDISHDKKFNNYSVCTANDNIMQIKWRQVRNPGNR